MMLNAYLNRQRLAGYRPETIATRERVLAVLTKQLGGVPIERATRFDLEAMLGRDLSAATRRSYLSHFRNFYGWLVDEGFRVDNPTDRIPSIRVPVGVPRPIQQDDLARALIHAGPRMRAWLLLMALAGLRCIEVAHLRPQDVQHSPHGTLLYLREVKGGGTATVPAHEAILGVLAGLPRYDGLWWHATPHHVSITTGRYLHGLGIDATAHQLRHYAGTDWYRASGHDLLTTATLLRHRSVSTSQIYAALDPTRPAEVVRMVAAPSLRDLPSAS